MKELSFGILCPPLKGHLYPMISLCSELKLRGYRVVLFYYIKTDFIEKIAQQGIETVAVCTDSEAYLLAREIKILGKLTGWKANVQTFSVFDTLTRINLRCLTEKIRISESSILLIDQTFLEGESIASLMDLPFVSICNALLINPDLNLPPVFLKWQYKSSVLGKIRNYFGYIFVGLKSGDSMRLISEYRKQKNLPSYPSKFKIEYYFCLWSNIGTIAQHPKEFEFPRSLAKLGKNFYFTSPFINPNLREEIEFPWEKLNGKPLIYASLGTLQNSVGNIFNKIAQACIGLDYQLVISLGQKGSTRQMKSINKLPDEAIMVDYAPQLKLLKKASLCITHAGINTTLESLSNGVPIVAIPIANDQPGVGARIEWTGTGKVLKYNCKVSQLNKAIEEVLKNDIYRQNASKIQQEIQNVNGVKRAVDIIEEALIL